MKIATYNVRNLYDSGTKVDDTAPEVVQEDFFNARIEYFTAQLRPLELDIICFQEIGGEQGLRMIAESLSYECFFAKPNTRGIRMAVLYKKELQGKVTCESVSFGELFIPSIQTKGDTQGLLPISQRRDVLVTTFENKEGKTVKIVTFHLKSLLPMYLEGEMDEGNKQMETDANFRAIFYKTMELRALRFFVIEELRQGRELILLGDFNEHHAGGAFNIVKSSRDESYRLHDILAAYQGNKTTHTHRGMSLTFDTMLVSKGLIDTVTNIAVHNEALRKDYSMLPPGAIEHEIESDHALVTAEFPTL